MFNYFLKGKNEENLGKWKGLTRLITLKSTSFGGDTLTYVIENTGRAIPPENITPIKYPPISVFYRKESPFPFGVVFIPEEANALVIGERYKLKKIPEEIASASFCRLRNISFEDKSKKKIKEK